MKATTKVSISGIAFNIDNDACTVLEQYLNSLRKHFETKAEGKEIVEDIESRLAELLLIRTEEALKVVTLDDANQVIAIMGKPSDMFDEESDNANTTQNNTSTQSEPMSKRLYRDVDNKVIAGVCSGLGNYFNLDPVIIRIAFFVLMFVLIPFNQIGPLQISSIWIYLALWISVPKAINAKQKLEMKGKDLSINNIEQQVRDEIRQNEENPPRQNLISEIIEKVVEIFVRFIGGVLMTAGVVAIIVTFGILFGFIFSDKLFISSVDIIKFDTWPDKLFILFILLTPLFILAHCGAKMLFFKKIKTSDLGILAIFVCILIASISYFGFNGFFDKNFFKNRNKYNTTILSKEIKHIPIISDTLYVNIAQEFTDSSTYELSNNNIKININANNSRIWLGEHQGVQSIYYIPPIRLRYKDGIDNFQIGIQKRKNKIGSRETSNFNIEYTQTDSLLLIKPIIFKKGNKWKGDKIEYIIYAPSNKKIILEEPLRSRMLDGEEETEIKLEDFSITF